MDSDVAKIADNCFRLSMADGSWQALGFGRRSRRGVIWRLTTPAWKVALEDRVHRELLLILSAAHITAFESTNGPLLQGLVEFYWGNGEDGFAALFPSREFCLRTINEYVGTPFADWHKLLWGHLEVFAVPDKKLRARLLVNCIQFAMNVPVIKRLVTTYGIEMVSWPKPKTHEVAIRDDLAAIHQIFEITPNSSA